jgi:hypothetical protein
MESRLKTPKAYGFSLDGTQTHTLSRIVPFESIGVGKEVSAGRHEFIKQLSNMEAVQRLE